MDDEIRTARSQADIAAATALVWEFFDFVRGRYPDMLDTIQRYIEAQDVRGQLADFEGTFLPPKGDCFLASMDGEAVGIVLLKRLDAKRAEMNRMYVRAAARGRGLGRKLCDALIAEARRQEFDEIILDGLYRHVEARSLYASLGFEEYLDPAAFDANDDRVFHMKLSLRT